MNETTVRPQHLLINFQNVILYFQAETVTLFFSVLIASQSCNTNMSYRGHLLPLYCLVAP